MTRHDLNFPFAVYQQSLGTKKLPDGPAEQLLSLCEALGLSRVAVFGSNSGSGEPLRAALGEKFSFMLNSDTISPDVAAVFDAVLLGTHPRHYPAVMQTLKRNFPGRSLQLLAPFQEECRVPAFSSDPQTSPLGKRVRPCHYQDLFVRHDGDLFPCCLTRDNERFKIGNIRDEDITDRLAGYDIGQCQCPEWAFNSIFRPAGPEDRVDIAMLNVELSLFCNSACAMCCVHSPQYTKDFGKPDASTHEGILRLFARFKPHGAYFQGGEVLVQPEAFGLVEAIRKQSPEMPIALITNANVPQCSIERAAELYDSFCIGFYGFQPHTYKTVTGLDIQRAKRSVRWLTERDRKKVCLKYLSTAVSFHEAPLFLEWALDVKPQSIMLVDADTQNYVRYAKPEGEVRFGNTSFPLNDLYWDKIFTRTKKRIDTILETNSAYIRDNGISVITCGGLFSQP